MKKFLLFDTETSGTNPDIHGVHQIGGLIYVCDKLTTDIEPVDSFNFYANCFEEPYGIQLAEWLDKEDKITVRNALEVSGVDLETVMNYPKYAQTFNKVMSLFEKHVDKFDKNDKFICIGYNIEFDTDMLRGWAKSVGYKYINSFVGHQTIDVMDLARLCDAMGLLPVEVNNHKLETMCKVFNIEIKAHDALSDITATKDLLICLIELLQGSKNAY